MTAGQSFDMILLEMCLPDIGGMKVLRSLREWSETPIIAVSASNDEQLIVEALDAGADGYIVKPFGNNELLARMRAVFRIYKKINSGRTGADEVFSAMGLTIDYDKRTVTKNEKRIHLTPIEYKITVLLSRNAGKALTHDYIIKRVWSGESDEQSVRVNMANIRRKIEDDPSNPKLILTETGVGYRMVAP
jgi:two-component system KDP operon response regulator KdpE